MLCNCSKWAVEGGAVDERTLAGRVGAGDLDKDSRESWTEGGGFGVGVRTVPGLVRLSWILALGAEEVRGGMGDDEIRGGIGGDR
jgi:hypothetical protein